MYIVSWGGVRLSSIGMSATNWHVLLALDHCGGKLAANCLSYGAA
jgi:hypothetical protein